jgi:hypothetical protein
MSLFFFQPLLKFKTLFKYFLITNSVNRIMKNLLKIMSLFCATIILISILTTCSSNDDGDGPTEPTNGNTENTTEQISSTNYGNAATPSGSAISVIAGSVPQNASGQDGQVTFSIETNVEQPASFMPGMSQEGGVTKFGPDGFNFRWPVRVALPYSGDGDPGDYTVSFYDAVNESWRVVSSSEVDMNEKVIYADVIELGFFSLTTLSQNGLQKTNLETSNGGFEYGGTTGYFYTLTVASFSNLKYPWQLNYFGGNLVGYTGASGHSPTGTPLSPTHIRLPQGDYQIWISRTTPGTLSTLPQIETYSVPASGSLSGPVTYSQTNQNGSGWVALTLPGGGNWVDGRPDGWPVPTSTYGTGEFQATLTWANISGGKSSDLDLHLFGPNDLHVYYGNYPSSDGSLTLDVDNQEDDFGTVAENIYSLSNFPSGQYTIRVNLFSGSATNFNLRVIYKGSVRTFQRSISRENSADNIGDMLEVYTFNH